MNEKKNRYVEICSTINFKHLSLRVNRILGFEGKICIGTKEADNRQNNY
jgi:hypothetical protein